MKKTKYFIAAVYQRLNEKDSDTPYLNIRLIITVNAIFHIAQLIVWLKNSLHRNLFSNSDGLLVTFFLIMGYIVFYISGLIFPRDILEEVEIKKNDKAICYRIAVSYFIINFSLLMYLLIHYLPVKK